MTVEAPAASARATSLGCRTPPSAQTCAPSRRASAAHYSTALNCGRPTPVIIRGVHPAPGPTPTFTMSAPAPTRSRTPSAVTTLPAATGTGGPVSRTAPSALNNLSRPTRAGCAEHVVARAVRGVHHEEVDPGRDQLLGLARAVAVDADRGADPQPPV